MLVFVLLLCSTLFHDYLSQDSCPVQCKITKTCIEISQKCDDIVNCCQGDVIDQTDEAYCGTILSPLPAAEIEMLESLMNQLIFHILPEFGTDDYIAYWFINGIQIGQSDSSYDIKLTDTLPRYYSFTFLNPDIALNNSTLTFQMIEKRRTYESVCNKKPSIKGSFETKLFVKKRPGKPLVNIYNRKTVLEGRQKGFYLACSSVEGFTKPKLFWVKTVKKVSKEYESNLMTDVLDSKKIYTLLLVAPQTYVDTSIQCKTTFDFLNETQSDISEENVFDYPSIESTSSEGEMIVKHGLSLNLTCTARGFPPPIYKWAYSASSLIPVPIRLSTSKKTFSNTAHGSSNFLNTIWLTIIGKKKKPTYVNKDFIYIASAGIEHTGSYQCIASNEIGDSGSNIIQVIVPDPSLGMLSSYFSSRDSLIGFVLGMFIFLIAVGLVMYFVYVKITKILENRNKLLMEQATEARKKIEEARAGRHRKVAAAAQGPIPIDDLAIGTGGRKVLKGPPPVSEVEKPFISVMDQANIVPLDEEDGTGAGLAKFDDSNFIPPIFVPEKPGQKSLLDFVPQFEYPEEDEDQILNILKK